MKEFPKVLALLRCHEQVQRFFFQLVFSGVPRSPGSASMQGTEQFRRILLLWGAAKIERNTTVKHT